MLAAHTPAAFRTDDEEEVDASKIVCETNCCTVAFWWKVDSRMARIARQGTPLGAFPVQWTTNSYVLWSWVRLLLRFPEEGTAVTFCKDWDAKKQKIMVSWCDGWNTKDQFGQWKLQATEDVDKHKDYKRRKVSMHSKIGGLEDWFNFNFLVFVILSTVLIIASNKFSRYLLFPKNIFSWKCCIWTEYGI